MAVQLTVRLSEATTLRIDSMATSAGLTRAQVVRMLLSQASQADLPAGLVENADRLRDARGAVR